MLRCHDTYRNFRLVKIKIDLIFSESTQLLTGKQGQGMKAIRGGSYGVGVGQRTERKKDQAPSPQILVDNLSLQAPTSVLAVESVVGGHL